ncbi:LLM class F420-dependent oxidoreductase [Streptomonospora nanhaiensis]|uniref:F420-dependent oxidoreductase-like protein n=1 Tax=Streptomonospora nanhaiensis TaxID=1323731 RepID=A0A853BI81_9ACTN|nr:LLM class F420-dependent oxidoreductase [Streptomonospora nanhaiensis]MBV2362352.1 LLM class F420-dependent oxidoreductase [Streptomonospora nanhaiensis]MBX9391159.1 LLM class F420-dependent oxidoreductase [Streptomonospora nanhaiensis]NYI94993.1 F420-dependent oxidoreductase-like protein [Streptomonospora nanhaiensis]
MRISMPLQYAGEPKPVVDQVAELEKVGLDTVWVAEAYGYDSPTLMGYIAARTERVNIGSAILPLYTRTPALIAQTAAGLDYLSDGRAVLGLGASGPQVIEGWHGVPYTKPLARTREIIEICRKIWAREERVVHEGSVYTLPLPPEQGTGLGKPLKIINHPVRSAVPVFVAALGEKNVELTAEVADGWLPHLFIPEKADAVWGPALARGRAKRDPALGELAISAGGLLAIGEGEETRKLADLTRPMIALYVGGMGAKGRNFYNDVARRYGFEDAAERIQDLYLAGRKDEAAAAVPDEFVELTNLVGPESYVRERVAAFRAAGVTHLNVTPVGDDPVRLVEKLHSWL